MSAIRWLHLTDLHAGMPGMSTLWQAVKSDFWTDLERLHEAVGGIDVVIFTGDIAYSGKAEEYAKANDWLTELFRRLGALGSSPVFVAVPGNHDLRWPNASSPYVRALLNWPNDQDLRASFWENDSGKEWRDFVNELFRDYVRWLGQWRASQPAPAGVGFGKPGLLAGDFAASIERDGLSLGLVGLNSAFLQLGGRVVRGQLAIDPSQLHTVTDGDPDGWARKHDACFLLTHHPPDWLAPDALSLYQGTILLPQWFAGHFCGHMHEPVMVAESIGGGPAHRLLLGASIFGLDRWTDARGQHEQRVHGYSVGSMTRKGAEIGTLRIYPRTARALAGTGRWRLVPDFDHYELDGDAFTVDIPLRAPRIQAAVPPGRTDAVAMFVASAEAAPTVTAGPTSRPYIQPPGAGYDPAWYVPRVHQERLVLDVLRHPGAPVVVTASPLSSKTTVLRRLVGLLRDEDKQGHKKRVVVPIDLGLLPEQVEADPAKCFRELASLLVDGFGKAVSERGEGVPTDIDDWLDRVWQRPGTPERRLGALLERQILAMGYDRVVLVFDRFERIVGTPAGNPVARMLRQWVDARDDGRWTPLRLLVAATGLSLFFSTPDAVSEFFNTALQVRLENFGLPELAQLAQLHGGGWSNDELEQLLELVDGQPYLSRLIMFLAASGTPKEELLNVERLKLDHCAGILLQMWLRYKDRSDVLQPFCALLKDKDRKLPPDQYALLYQAGLVRRVDGAFVVTNQLLASYFKDRC